MQQPRLGACTIGPIVGKGQSLGHAVFSHTETWLVLLLVGSRPQPAQRSRQAVAAMRAFGAVGMATLCRLTPDKQHRGASYEGPMACRGAPRQERAGVRLDG